MERGSVRGEGGIAPEHSNEMRRVSIDASLMADREMLEDLLVAAFNDASHKAEATVQEKMGALTAGRGLPPGLKLPV